MAGLSRRRFGRSCVPPLEPRHPMTDAAGFYVRILVHLRRSDGIPNAEGSPQDGHVPVPDAKANAQSSGLDWDSNASSSKKYWKRPSSRGRT